MAYVPDEAIDRMYVELSPAAMALYVYYCKKRNRKSGSFSCPEDVVLGEMKGMSRATYNAAKSELKNKGWIPHVRGNNVRPIVGFESPETQTTEGHIEVQKFRLESPEIQTTELRQSPEIQTESPEIQTSHICITKDLTSTMSATADETKDSFDDASNTSQKRTKRNQSAKGHPHHQRGMAFLVEHLGGSPGDMSAQGKALKELLANGYSIEEIEQYLPPHIADYREKGLRPSFLSLGKMMPEYRARNRQAESITNKVDYCDRCRDMPTPGWLSGPRGAVRCSHALIASPVTMTAH
jgi:hypothetical protein